MPSLDSVLLRETVSPASEEEFISAWDSEIRMRARASARRGGRPTSDADDMAQEIRLRLFLAFRRYTHLDERYVRRIITNTLRSEWRKHRQSPILVSAENDLIDDRRQELGADALASRAVSQWARTLATGTLSIFRLLYHEGYSQREAAAIMGFTQARVAQLHGQLLTLGRKELTYLRDAA